MTQSELIWWADRDFPWLYGQFQKLNLTGWLKLRREMQEATTRYSKGRKLDQVQENIQSVMRWIEIACWHRYRDWSKVALIKTNPALMKVSEQKLKTHIRKNWEKLLKKYTF